jgi:hypothetical protein
MASFFFGKGSSRSIAKDTSEPAWAKNESGNFHRLLDLEPDKVLAKGTGGIYLIWHRGFRPHWLYAGASDDLAAALTKAAADEEFASYEVNGRLICTWAPIRPEHRAGAVLYLRDVLKPIIAVRPSDEIDRKTAEPIAIKLPT